MITSDKQCNTAKMKLTDLETSLQQGADSSLPDIIRETSEGQLKSLMSDIRSEIEEYERLKSSSLEDLRIQSFQDVLLTPIRYRIASKMSVEAFGRKVGVSARQLHRYESENYSNVNTRTLTKILDKLDVHLDGKVAS